MRSVEPGAYTTGAAKMPTRGPEPPSRSQPTLTPSLLPLPAGPPPPPPSPLRSRAQPGENRGQFLAHSPTRSPGQAERAPSLLATRTREAWCTHWCHPDRCPRGCPGPGSTAGAGPASHGQSKGTRLSPPGSEPTPHRWLGSHPSALRAPSPFTSLPRAPPHSELRDRQAPQPSVRAPRGVTAQAPNRSSLPGNLRANYLDPGRGPDCGGPEGGGAGGPRRRGAGESLRGHTHWR